MVMVDRLNKVPHSILMMSTHKETNVVKINMWEIVNLYGVSKAIIWDRNTKFTSNFWLGLFKGFRSGLNFSTTYHINLYGKMERVN